MDRKTLKALAEAHDGDDRPDVKPLTRNDIREWAEDGHGGGLPAVSARAFADWLNGVFFDYGDEDSEQTNEDVLKSARAFWVGEK